LDSFYEPERRNFRKEISVAEGMIDGVSVVICCHNGAKRLPETLRHLAAQEVPGELSWEVLLIDNASTDDTAKVARQCWPESLRVPLRVVTEPRLGIANARFRSFSESRQEIISFIDDDNRVGPTWLVNVTDFFQRHPEVSAVGGPSRAVFEATPPHWFSTVSPFYAIGDQHAFAGDITNEQGTLLWTAGMSLRRGSALELIRSGFRFIACGGSSLTIKTGEDTELCFALRALGGRLYYDPRLAIEHFMPADRLVWPKALSLMRTMGASSVLFGIYLCALDIPPYSGRPEWKKGWLFFTLKALHRLAGLLLFHSLECLRRPEGSVRALEFQKAAGQLVTLWALRGRYRTLQRTIQQSAWARGRAKPEGKP
jgi:glycosyltransferase involved in cell wall biosynthesis